MATAMYLRLFEDPASYALFNHGNQGEGGVQGHALAGVAPERIHHEFFGPADELLAA